MYCTKCGIQLSGEARYCSQCGQRTALGETFQPRAQRSLMLDKRHKKIAGVCAGFARYLETDVVLVRVLWLGVALATGVGFLAYVAAWIIMPSDYGFEPRAMPAPFPQAG